MWATGGLRSHSQPLVTLDAADHSLLLLPGSPTTWLPTQPQPPLLAPSSKGWGSLEFCPWSSSHPLSSSLPHPCPALAVTTPKRNNRELLRAGVHQGPARVCTWYCALILGSSVPGLPAASNCLMGASTWTSHQPLELNAAETNLISLTPSLHPHPSSHPGSLLTANHFPRSDDSSSGPLQSPLPPLHPTVPTFQTEHRGQPVCPCSLCL